MARRTSITTSQLSLPGFELRTRRFEWRQLDPAFLLRQQWRTDPECTPPLPDEFHASASAESAAARFPKAVREHVLRLIRQDPTERIAQLALSAPGVIVFWCGLAERSCTALAARRLCRRIQCGHTPASVLDELVHACCPSRVAHVAGWKGPILLHDSCTPERHKRQRLLVLKAGPRVEPRLLLTSFPRVFVPEDIPRDAVANRRWYEVMAPAQELQNVSDNVEIAVYRFASRHALELRSMEGGPRLALRRLLRFCAATRRHPDRKTSAAGLLEELTQWERRRERDVAVMARCPGFPPPPLPGWESASTSIAPITSAEALVDEASRMHHCVASRAGRVVRGLSYFYSVRAGSHRSTLEVQHRAVRWIPFEHRGPFNAAPTSEECRAVEQWFRALSSTRAR